MMMANDDNDQPINILLITMGIIHLVRTHEGGGRLRKSVCLGTRGRRVGRTKAYVRKIKKIQISFSIDWQNYLRFLLLSLFHRSLFPFHLSPNSLRNFTNIFHVSYTLILQLFLYGS